MGVGRVVCVALPFVLTVGSLIFLLVACLGGVSNKDLYMFRVNTTKLSIDPANLDTFIDRVGARTVQIETGFTGEFAPLAVRSKLHGSKAQAGDEAGDASDVASASSQDDSSSGAQTGNITAADLGLGDLYDIALWGYCATDASGKKECTKAKFNWAADALNTSSLETLGAITGKKIRLPDEISTSLQAFITVSKWTQVAYIIAFIALALEVIFGIFASCTRVMSCLTFIVSGVATLAVVSAASLSTAMSVIVVGAVESTAKFYGVKSNFNTTFLSLVWISAALAIGAGFFWMFTICCCAPSHKSRKDRKRHTADAEKLLPVASNAYQPLHEPQNTGFYNKNAPQYGAPRHPSGARSDLAYEPYSHRG